MDEDCKGIDPKPKVDCEIIKGDSIEETYVKKRTYYDVAVATYREQHKQCQKVTTEWEDIDEKCLEKDEICNEKKQDCTDKQKAKETCTFEFHSDSVEVCTNYAQCHTDKENEYNKFVKEVKKREESRITQWDTTTKQTCIVTEIEKDGETKWNAKECKNETEKIKEKIEKCTNHTEKVPVWNNLTFEPFPKPKDCTPAPDECTEYPPDDDTIKQQTVDENVVPCKKIDLVIVLEPPQLGGSLSATRGPQYAGGGSRLPQ